MIIRRAEDIRPSEIMLLGKMTFKPLGAIVRIVALLRAVNVGGTGQTPDVRSQRHVRGRRLPWRSNLHRYRTGSRVSQNH